MLKRGIKRSAKYNESMPELLGKDLEKDLDAVDTKMEDDEQEIPVEEVDVDGAEGTEDSGEIEDQQADAEEIPDHLDTELEEPEETFKDINEKVVVYLYRGFAELGDNVRVFVEDEENEERDPELVETLQDFMAGYPDVMAVIKELANKYVETVELFDPEEEEEIPVEDDAEEIDLEDSDAEEVDLEDDIEDLGVVEAYVKENNLEHNLFETEYEIYARYTSEEQAQKYETELSKLKGAEVFRHEDIGEIHAFIKVK